MAPICVHFLSDRVSRNSKNCPVADRVNARADKAFPVGERLVGRAEAELLKETISNLQEAGIMVSLFVDPSVEAIKQGHRLGANAMEINTGLYSEVRDERSRQVELDKVAGCCKLLAKLGLKVLAGHGLDYQNVVPIAQIPEVEELNIGHSIIARASLVGMERAVGEMLDLLQ